MTDDDHLHAVLPSTQTTAAFVIAVSGFFAAQIVIAVDGCVAISSNERRLA